MNFPAVVMIQVDPPTAFRAAQEIPDLREQFESVILGTVIEPDYREWLRQNGYPEPKPVEVAGAPEGPSWLSKLFSKFKTGVVGFFRKADSAILNEPLPPKPELPSSGQYSKGSVTLKLVPAQALLLAKICPSARDALEPVIACDPAASLEYSREVLQGRFPAGERTLAGNPTLALEYARHMNAPFEAAEQLIFACGDEHLIGEYVKLKADRGVAFDGSPTEATAGSADGWPLPPETPSPRPSSGSPGRFPGV